MPATTVETSAAGSFEFGVLGVGKLHASWFGTAERRGNRGTRATAVARRTRSWAQHDTIRAERSYHRLIHFNEVDRGGHFTAWEEPELFAAELRAAFRSVRC
jgi:pimeloyl-ACP methyl ester carboxylesterase